MLFLICSLLRADPFYSKSMQEKWEPQYAMRSLLLPKGWSSVSLEGSSKISQHYRDDEGMLQSIEPSLWNYNTLHLRYQHGLSRNLTLYFDIPWVLPVLHTQDQGTISSFALGDVHSGILMRLTPQKNDSEIVLGVSLKSPSGAEWPASAKGSPYDIQGFLTGTGTTNLTATMFAKKNISHFYSLIGSASYTYTFRSVVGYIIEADGFGHGMLDPGNYLKANLENRLQLGSALSMSLSAHFSYQSEYYMGVSGAGIGWENPQQIRGSSQFLDGLWGVRWEPTPQWSWEGSVLYQILGTDTRLFSVLGLEEFSPQPGWVFSLGGTRRW